MPLGFSPLASGPTGASVTHVPTTTTSSGVTVPVLGLLITSSLGAPTAGVESDVFITGVQATGQIGQFGIETPNMTSILVDGFGVAVSLGDTTQSTTVSVEADGLESVCVQGSIEHVAVGSVVLTGLEITASLGAPVATAPSRWIEIEPVSTPSWQAVSTLN